MTTPIRAIYDAEHQTLKLLDPIEAANGEIVSVQLVDDSVTPATTPRIAGLHKGNWWISDDFDDELPDSFWLGEDK